MSTIKQPNNIKSEIIPVTHAIRNYINNEKNMSEFDSFIASRLGFSLESYRKNKMLESNNLALKSEIIYHFSHEDKVFNRQMVLLGEALENDRSLIWIYQEMVLSGYGYAINPESIMYRAAVAANNDVSLVLEEKGEFEAIHFENLHVLKGKKYEELVKKENDTKEVVYQKKIGSI